MAEAAEAFCPPTGTDGPSFPAAVAASLTVIPPAASITVQPPITDEDLDALPPAGEDETGEGSGSGKKKRNPTQLEIRSKMEDADLFILFCDLLQKIS